MNAVIKIPSDASIFLELQGEYWTVTIVRPHGATDYRHAAATTHCSLVDDPGFRWNEAKGAALANATLAFPFSAAFILFDKKALALNCLRRLVGGRTRRNTTSRRTRAHAPAPCRCSPFCWFDPDVRDDAIGGPHRMEGDAR